VWTNRSRRLAGWLFMFPVSILRNGKRQTGHFPEIYICRWLNELGWIRDFGGLDTASYISDFRLKI
jgi:hypothetical protein